jgi:hypothetical protein
MSRVRFPLRSIIIVALFAPAGCGDTKPPNADPNEEAKAKVEAMKRLAEVMARDANSPEVFEALEGFRNISMDPAKHPDATREILEIYKTQIEGKYKGEFAQQVQLELNAFRNIATKK